MCLQTDSLESWEGGTLAKSLEYAGYEHDPQNIGPGQQQTIQNDEDKRGVDNISKPLPVGQFPDEWAHHDHTDGHDRVIKGDIGDMPLVADLFQEGAGNTIGEREDAVDKSQRQDFKGDK